MTFDPTVREKVCIECKVAYEEEFFEQVRRGTRSPTATMHRRPICMGCERTAHDQKKQRDRMLQKIRDVIRRHAQKLGVARERLVHHYGWTVEKLRHDALDHYENKGCGYCEKAFHKGDTMNDLTLDIVDPNRPPFYSFNVKWICNACNRMKLRASPVIFHIRLAMWKRWHAAQAKLKAAPPPPPLPPEPCQQWLLPELAPV